MKTDIEQITTDLVANIDILRRHILAQSSPEAEDALAWVETFCAVSARVLAKTNPSKIRDAARIEEIKARIHGKEVIE